MVNSKMLYFIKDNMDQLSSAGLLLPPFLANVNPSLVRKELQTLLSSGEYKDKLKYSTLEHIISKRIKRARYEQFLLSLASAYEGLRISFPAFMDFRGRI